MGMEFPWDFSHGWDSGLEICLIFWSLVILGDKSGIYLSLNSIMLSSHHINSYTQRLPVLRRCDARSLKIGLSCSFLANNKKRVTKFSTSIVIRSFGIFICGCVEAMARAGLNEREATCKVVTARCLSALRKFLPFHLPSFQLCSSIGQKRQN